MVHTEQEAAEASLVLTGTELKKRTLTVTLADAKAKIKCVTSSPPPDQADRGLAYRRPVKTSTSGLPPREDLLARSVRLKGLPPRTQEGLLQQELSKLVRVEKVEVFERIGEGTVELGSAAVS